MVNSSGVVNGSVRTVLRLEALALLIASVLLYAHLGASWTLFAILFLTPDLSMLAYFAGPRIGAAAYNLAHATIAPIAAALLGYLSNWTMLEAIGLIWLAHVGIDRALGFGLKYASAFGDTHLGRIGRATRRLEQPA
ncbi:MAG TPA: DUF4260 domain-containing protein [Rhizomicrobium sp.]|jgi:hypothetical protein|nr:DUF4260 domain-containing protein [Rhizomicrobium sp.]